MQNKIAEKIFGGVNMPQGYSNLRKAEVVILQCPYELTASYKKGTKNGPQAIIDASNYIELFDDELKREIYKIGIYTKTPLRLENLFPGDMVKRIHDEVWEVLKAEKLPVLIGGEHSISIGAVWTVSKFYNDLSVLHLDAHHDLRNKYEGSKYNHACVARRFLDFCPVVQVGTRSLCKEEQDFINTDPPHLKIIDAYETLENPLWKEKVVESLSNEVYISLDLDVFDPSIMPSVGTPEPGGIGWYELLDLFKRVARNKKIIGFDVVELLPIQNLHSPDFLTAKLIYRLLGYISFLGKKEIHKIYITDKK